MEDELPSEDDERTEIENSLYSMFYYHSLSEGLPDDLAEKYDIDSNDFGVTISLKDTNDSNCENFINKSKVNYSRQTTNDRYLETRDDSGIVLDVPVLNSVLTNSDDLDKNVTVANNITPTNIYRKPRYFDDNTIESSKKSNRLNSSKSGTKLFKTKNKTSETFEKLNYHVELSLSSKKSNDWKSYKTNINMKKVKIISANSHVVDLTEDVNHIKSSSVKPQNDTKKKRNNKNRKMESDVIAISSDSETESISNSSESDTDVESDFSFDNSIDTIKINTNRSYNDDNCGVFINTDYDWRETSSPEGWTVSMRRFYNKPSKEMINFNHEDFLNEVRKSDDNDWSIITADQWNFKRTRQIRCIRCNQEGHVKSNCTKIFSCLLCGLPGHLAKICPNNKCFKCGLRRHGSNLSDCSKCSYESTTVCSLCGIEGHPSDLCTDSWRYFISVNGGSKSKKKSLKYCCNCAKQGHTYDDCKKSTSVSQFKQVFHKQSQLNAEVTFPRKNNFKKPLKRSYIESNLIESNNFILSNKKKTKIKHKANKTKNVQFKRSKFDEDHQSSPINKRNNKRNPSRRLHMLRRTNKRNYNEHIGMGQYAKMLKRF